MHIYIYLIHSLQLLFAVHPKKINNQVYKAEDNLLDIIECFKQSKDDIKNKI